MDTIGDYLTIIRNSSNAENESCTIPHSNIREEITKILKSEGYIRGFKIEVNDKEFKEIIIALKYVDGTPAIRGIQRVSKPGCRLYFQYREIPRVLGGLGISILTTSMGLRKDRDARREKVGGELLCRVW